MNTCKFTCEIWIPKAILLIDKQDNVSEIASKTFPYLNIEFFWNADEELEYQVHRTPNKKLKYLNTGSTHTNTTFSAIPSGIF